MKKKVVSGLLAMALVFNSGGYTFAVQQISGAGAKGNMKVIKNVTTAYAIEIPESISIPDSRDVVGIPIDVRAVTGSHIKNDTYVNVTISYDSNDVLQDSCVRMKNGSSIIYAPLIVADGETSKDITKINASKTAKKVQQGSVVACFGATSKTDPTMKKLKGIIDDTEERNLYVYRAYVGKTENNNVGPDWTNVADTQLELGKGTYEGNIVFEISQSNALHDLGTASLVPEDRTFA